MSEATEQLESQNTQQQPKPESPHSAMPISVSVPYLNSYGVITKTLERIKTASTPPRFTQDFLSTKLDLKGGSAMAVIPFLKKTGFLNGDGTPTDLYKEFRNTSSSSRAAASAIKKGYALLYEINEYTHNMNDNDLKGVIVQATGLDSKSSTVRAILGSYKALKSFAKFEDDLEKESEMNPSSIEKNMPEKQPEPEKLPMGLKLGYVINLNLPATTDIAVFDAIFKSLREHILE